ncbi:MAG: two-component system sensor histidine kinase NtrB, partial [Planctomycetota bacterium]
SGIAHEIRNPLNSVQGFVQLLQESAPDEEQSGYCTIVLEEVARINRIVQEMLDFARDQPYSMDRVDPGALARSLVDLLGPEAQGAGLDFGLADLPAELPAVRGNADRLKQVLLNLLRNAFQATPSGGRVTFSVTTAADEETGVPRVRFAVTDTGCGIPPDAASRIFDPFYTTKDDGTGLGLSICQKIAEQHAGRLSVQSREGEGSTFTLEIPGLA